MLWRRVIRAKYRAEEGDWCSNSVLGSYGVSLWKTISSGWSTFSCYIQFQIGDETRVKFWQDIRCGSFDRVGWKFADLRARVD